MPLKSFDGYFQGYKALDNGGVIDKEIINDAKKIYTSFQTLENIKVLRMNFKKHLESSPETIDKKAALKFRSICLASGYADYVNKYRQMYSQASNASNIKSTIERIRETILSPSGESKI